MGKINVKDNQVVSYTCKSCARSFLTKSGLYKHTQKIHPEPELTLIQRMGRPPLYKEEYCDELLEWFSGIKYEKIVTERTTRFGKDGKPSHISEKFKYVAVDLPTLSGFARNIGVTHETLRTWATEVIDEKADNPVKKYPNFSVAYNTAKSLQKEFLIDNALKGHYPPASFIFIAKNITDMTDKQIIETEDKNYKEKKDTLNAWFDSIRHHTTPGPGSTEPDAPAS